MKKKTVVIFDIDFTVFNTAAFRRTLYKLLAQEMGYSDFQEFYTLAQKTEQKTKEQAGYFKPQIFLSLLQKKAKTKVTLIDLRKLFFNESLYIESLYEDAREVFQELVMRRDIAVIIFSTGEKEFQMRKVGELQRMLKEDQIHIFADKLLRLKDILLQYQDNHIYLVDDLPTVLYEAKKIDPTILTIWINHDKQVHEKDFLDPYEEVDGFKADATVANLNEIIPLITGV